MKDRTFPLSVLKYIGWLIGGIFLIRTALFFDLLPLNELIAEFFFLIIVLLAFFLSAKHPTHTLKSLVGPLKPTWSELWQSLFLSMIGSLVFLFGLISFFPLYASSGTLSLLGLSQIIYGNVLGENTLFVFLLSNVFLAPIIEEFIFKGIFVNYFGESSHRITWYIILSIVFTFLHQGEDRLSVNFFQLFLVSLIWTVMYIKTKKLLLPMFMHAWNNFFILIAFPYLLNIFIPEGEFMMIGLVRNNTLPINIYIPSVIGFIICTGLLVYYILPNLNYLKKSKTPYIKSV